MHQKSSCRLKGVVVLHEASEREKVALLAEEVLFIYFLAAIKVFPWICYLQIYNDSWRKDAAREARQQAENSVIWWIPLDEDM